MTSDSPYKNIPPQEWNKVTKKLIEKHPLGMDELKEIVLTSWTDIFISRIGQKPYFIGKDILPKPQILGFFLHELIPLEFQRRYPKIWIKERSSRDKDLVYLPDDKFSIEIKTSSNPQSIFGNRSYAQVTENNKKTKSGYYLAINFEKIDPLRDISPMILKIRFGWLDHSDWMGQSSQTGQQSRLSREVESGKLSEIYSVKQSVLIT